MCVIDACLTAVAEHHGVASCKGLALEDTRGSD
jgi:hypothetical protein